jgi:hypothetical protein
MTENARLAKSGWSHPRRNATEPRPKGAFWWLAAVVSLSVSVSAASDQVAGCCGIDRPLVRAGGWPIPEVSLATSDAEPLRTEKLTVAGIPVTMRTYRGAGIPYFLPARATEPDASEPSVDGEDLRSTAVAHVYSAKGHPFCLFLAVRDEDDCPGCGISCLALVALYDNDGDGVFETLQPASLLPPHWEPTLPEWLHSRGLEDGGP